MNNKRPSNLNKLVRRFNILIDSFFGYDFLKVIPLKELNLNPEIVVQGSPSGNKYLKKLLKSLDIQYDDKILDIGCAKGSALKVMLRFPFKNIDGLELSPELVEIAKRNFQKLRTNRVEIFNENASCFMGYNNPVCHDLLIDSNFLLVKKYPDAWGNGINLYKKSF